MLDRYFTMNPLRKGRLELAGMLLAGAAALACGAGRAPFGTVVRIAGGALAVFALLLHGACELNHKQAHRNTASVTGIVSGGLYSKLRHPIYLSLILLYLGMALAFASWIALGLGILFSAGWIKTAAEEEKGLLAAFPEEYAAYMKAVPRRIFPGIY